MRPRPLVTIGLDKPALERLRAAVEGPVLAYAAPPRIEVRDGVTRVENPRVAGHMIEPEGIVWWGYFDDVGETRRALALSSTPTFPDVRTTLAHDDRVVSLALATRADGFDEPRSYVPAGARATFEGERVAKWGHRHCGEGKARVEGSIDATEPTLLEPYVEGTSERILFIGEAEWHLIYESSDWRKNVGATVTLRAPPEGELLRRARRLATRLGLGIVGIDFVVRPDRDATLLEVNAYPGLDDAPGATEVFVDRIAEWHAASPELRRSTTARRYAAQAHEAPLFCALEAHRRARDGNESLPGPRLLRHVTLPSFDDAVTREVVERGDEVWVSRLDVSTSAIMRDRFRLDAVGPSTTRIARVDARQARALVATLGAPPPEPSRGRLVIDGTRLEVTVGHTSAVTMSWSEGAAPPSWSTFVAGCDALVSFIDEALA